MMAHNASMSGISVDRLRSRQCSGSFGEEHYVLHRFFGGGRRDGARRGGVFFELGAFDGWKESNTLHLESCLDWRGVLMDAPVHVDWVRGNRPGAVSVGLAACPQAGYTNYSVQKATTAGILSYMSRSVRRRFKVDGAGSRPMQCGPLGGLFAQLNLRHIDYFSLDVQGAELMVLRSVDWHALTVGVLVTECKGLFCRDEQDAAVRRLMVDVAGMEWAGVLRARHDVWDAVYVNRSLVDAVDASVEL